MIIKLVRHGQSFANTKVVDPADVGDHTIEITPVGHEQAREAGRQIGADFLSGAMVYCSPYRRTRQTLESLIEGTGVPRDQVRVFEDPRLREVEGGYANWEQQTDLRKTHGWFYYRFQGGESPADCFDRTSGFIDSLMRQVERKNADRALIITHGLTIRCFVMRFLHLTVEQFETIDTLPNCGIVTLGPVETFDAPQFKSGKWGVSGLRLRG